MSNKSVIRERLLAQRRALSAAEVAQRSERAREQLLALPEVAGAGSVFVYVSAHGEVDTLEVMRELLGRGQVVAVPRIVGPGAMAVHRLRDVADLVPGPYGIPVPRTPEPMAATPEVTLVPAVAVTPTGDRLGWGGGYYDRFLARHPTTLPIALVYDFQVLDTLPNHDHDQPVRLIVTESRVIRCR